jgi:hypothetical protein
MTAFGMARTLAGKPLAEAGFSLSDDSTMIHFGVFQPKDSVGSCPIPYFSEDLQTIITEVAARSIDVKTGKPFESACVGKIDKEIYLRNYPDRVKYLEGNEEFY